MSLKTSSVTSKGGGPERKKPAVPDVVGTALLGVVGAVAVFMGLGYGFMRDENQIGPGFLPVLTGAFILVASLAEVARLYFSSGTRGGALMDAAERAEEEAKAAARKLKEESGEEKDTFGRTSAERNRAIVKVFFALFVALLLVPVTGLLLALTAMVLVIVLWVERKPVVPSVLISLGGLAAVYLIFVQILGVPVPQGMLGLI
ncbi:tripartite tricarboxylate transporter TctB family protein [Kocuria oceani]|uniref:tripartite tricarboxylate transporter TctB family protein n=1 Tax=Kocuria oceani TaxID=988827 RepID=UPI0040374A18